MEGDGFKEGDLGVGIVFLKQLVSVSYFGESHTQDLSRRVGEDKELLVWVRDLTIHQSPFAVLH